jgi:hypothetical protein
MKKIYSLTLLLFAAFSIKAQAPTPDLIHYKFNGTGSLVTNYASSPPAGTATGTIMGTQTQTGGINCMGALVGTGLTSASDYVNTNWAPNLGSGAWTLSFWTSNILQTTSTYYILGDVNSGGWRVFTGGVAGSGNWILRGSMTDVIINSAASTTPCMTSFVYSPTFSTIVAYLNGVPTTTVSQTAVAVTVTGSGPFKVGGYSTSASLNAGGLMADFRLYSSALTATDITNIYNYGVATLSLNITGTSLVCAGQGTQITANGANSYTWSTGAFTSSINVTPSVTSTYTLDGAAGNCTTSTTTTVTVNSLPTVSVSSSASVLCVGQTGSLTATGASGYVWNTTATTAVIVISPTTTTDYTVTGTDANNCVNTFTMSQVVSTCTGIDKHLSDLALSAFPNPTTGKVLITTRYSGSKEIELTDITGRVITQFKTIEPAFELDLNSYSTGVYVLKYTLNNQTSFIKLIKQ